METIIKTAQTISPIGIIFILAIVIYQLVKNGNVISLLRGTQINDKEIVQTKVATDAIDLAMLNTKLDQLALNHLHELPRLVETVDRMELQQSKQSERLACLETKVDLIINKKMI